MTTEKRNALKKLSLNNNTDKKTHNENLLQTKISTLGNITAETLRPKAAEKPIAPKIHFLEFEPYTKENNNVEENKEPNNNSSNYDLNCTEPNKTMLTAAAVPPTHAKEKRFFHRNDTELKEQKNSKRSTVVRREKVYEFLSQSQNSDSDENSTKTTKNTKSNAGHKQDPTADVVKRLIAQGKVRVATMRKGAGRPRLKKVKNSKSQKVQKKPKTNNKTQQQRKFEKVIAAHETSSAKELHPLAVTSAAVQFDDEQFNNQDDWQQAADDIDEEDNAVADRLAAIAKSKPTLTAPLNDNDGTFSRLARSVLLRQTNDRQNLEQKQKAKQLLDIARKIISTPKNDKTAQSNNKLVTTNLSPIAMPTTRFLTPQPRTYAAKLTTSATASSKASPWRVDNTKGMPSVFNFSRSSGNLPSFSSDFIRSTPKKNKTLRNSNISSISNNENVAQMLPVSFNNTDASSPQTENPRQTLPASRRSLTSSFNNNEGINPQNVNNMQMLPASRKSLSFSFSSNDSNAENKTPPPVSLTSPATSAAKAVNDENSNIFNLRQFPNPRRTLKNRSPLKAINILEVVQLPPWKKLNDIAEPASPKLQNTRPPVENLHNDDNNIENHIDGNKDIFKTPLKTTSGNKKQQQRQTDKMDLFGFEEFLSQTPSKRLTESSDDNEHNENNAINRHSITLHEKLRTLKRLRPRKTKEPQKATETVATNLDIFESNQQRRNWPQRQRNIKEMLCSTMVENDKLPELDMRPSTSKAAMKEFNKSLRNGNHQKQHFNMQPTTVDDHSISIDLFNDLEPETTFNEEVFI